MPDDNSPKIQIDSDWKAEAQREKERMAEQSKQAETAKPAAAGAAPGAAAGGKRRIPDASFETLVSTMTTQALLFMGAIPDPRSGQRIQSLDLSRHHIDMLAVIEEKTKGNLTEEEQKLISTTLYELRQRYIALSTAMRQQKYS